MGHLNKHYLSFSHSNRRNKTGNKNKNSLSGTKSEPFQKIHSTVQTQTDTKPQGTAPDALSGELDNRTSLCVITLINKPGGRERKCVCVCTSSPELVKNSRIILCQWEKSPVALRVLLGIFTLTKVTVCSQDINVSPKTWTCTQTHTSMHLHASLAQKPR